jgi:hypothetical protein
MANQFGWHYHDASVTKIMQAAGVDPVGDLTLEERLPAQWKLLTQYLHDISILPRPFITDRSPLDMIAYMLGEVTMHNTSAEFGQEIDEYVNACVVATRNNFDSIIILRPLPTYAAADGKPPPNPAYQWQSQMIMEGAYNLIRASVNGLIVPVDAYDFEYRCGIISKFLLDRVDRINDARQKSILH